MKLKEILLESVPDIIYHYTSIPSIVDILKTNKFRLKPAVGSDTRNNTKFYFLSTSRIKFGGYSRAYLGHGGVILVLDGRKFNQRYKGGSVDYWGREFRKGVDKERKLRNDENEERIYNDKIFIPNARSYIKEIHVFINKENLFTDKELQTLKRLCDNYNIPLYVYINKNDFKVLNKRKAIKEYVEKRTPTYITAVLNALNNKATKKDLHNFNWEGPDEFADSLKNEVQNYYKEYPYLIQQLTNAMRKYKIKDYKTFLKKVVYPKLRSSF